MTHTRAEKLSKKQNSARRRILFVATSFPEDAGGSTIRNYQLLKGLCGLPNTEVELFCLCSDNRIATATKKIEQDLKLKAHLFAYNPGNVLIKLHALLIDRMQPFMTEYRRRTGLGSAVRASCEANLPDVVHIEQIDAYFCLLPHIRWMRKQGIKIVLDAHNIEADVFEAANKTQSFAKRIVGELLVPSFRRLEDQAALTSDAIFACSQQDVDFFDGLRKSKPTYLAPNGVDCEQFTPSAKRDSATLLFVGGAGYPPNADALSFYFKEIHATVKQAVPNIKVRIIGTATDAWTAAQGLSGDTSVMPLGFVDDIRPYLDEATIGICPVRVGSGTRLKVLTYMASSLPIVSTTKGAEGILYTPGHEIAVADSASEFSDAIIHLLRNRRERRVMGGAGRSLVLQKYDWRMIAKKLRTDYQEILS